MEACSSPVGVMMYAYDDPAPLQGLCDVNAAYCKAWDYDFHSFTPDTIREPDRDATRHPVWGKIPLLRMLLQHYRYLVYLDGDAYFWDHSLPIEEFVGLPGFVEKHMRERSLLLPEDATRPGRCDTSVIILKNCAETDKMLGLWWAAPESFLHAGTRKQWPYDQTAFNESLYPAYQDRVTRVEPHLIGVGGSFIRRLPPNLGQTRQQAAEEVRTRLLGERVSQSTTS